MNKRAARLPIGGDPLFDNLPDPRVPWTPQREAILAEPEALQLEGGSRPGRVLRTVTRKVPCRFGEGNWLQALALVAVEGEAMPRWVSAERVQGGHA